MEINGSIKKYKLSTLPEDIKSDILSMSPKYIPEIIRTNTSTFIKANDMVTIDNWSKQYIRFVLYNTNGKIIDNDGDYVEFNDSLYLARYSLSSIATIDQLNMDYVVKCDDIELYGVIDSNGNTRYIGFISMDLDQFPDLNSILFGEENREIIYNKYFKYNQNIKK